MFNNAQNARIPEVGAAADLVSIGKNQDGNNVYLQESVATSYLAADKFFFDKFGYHLIPNSGARQYKKFSHHNKGFSIDINQYIVRDKNGNTVQITEDKYGNISDEGKALRQAIFDSEGDWGDIGNNPNVADALAVNAAQFGMVRYFGKNYKTKDKNGDKTVSEDTHFEFVPQGQLEEADIMMWSPKYNDVKMDASWIDTDGKEQISIGRFPFDSSFDYDENHINSSASIDEYFSNDNAYKYFFENNEGFMSIDYPVE